MRVALRFCKATMSPAVRLGYSRRQGWSSFGVGASPTLSMAPIVRLIDSAIRNRTAGGWLSQATNKSRNSKPSGKLTVPVIRRGAVITVSKQPPQKGMPLLRPDRDIPDTAEVIIHAPEQSAKASMPYWLHHHLVWIDDAFIVERNTIVPHTYVSVARIASELPGFVSLTWWLSKAWA